jgi:hypothetical protein
MSKGHDDYAIEPVRGLPERLPPGENMLWQGEPSFWETAKNVFHVRAVAVYFAALILWRVSAHLSASHKVSEAVLAGVSLLPIVLLGLSLLAVLAWLCSRTTVYTITDKRVVMRIGVALSTTINIPFKVVQSGGVRLHDSGCGDIPLALTSAAHVPYATLWPHARPWRLNHPEPMLRGVPDGLRVAKILSAALHDYACAGNADTSADLDAKLGSAAEIARPVPVRVKTRTLGWQA